MKPTRNPTHEEWLRALIEEGFPAQNILLIGARNIYPEERNFLKEKSIKTININSLLTNLEDATDFIMEFSQGKDLYVSLDIDFIDPEGTYLAWLDCKNIGMEDKERRELLLNSAKVLLDEGPLFGSGGEGFERINVACPRTTLEECMNRITNCIKIKK